MSDITHTACHIRHGTRSKTVVSQWVSFDSSLQEGHVAAKRVTEVTFMSVRHTCMLCYEEFLGFETVE